MKLRDIITKTASAKYHSSKLSDSEKRLLRAAVSPDKANELVYDELMTLAAELERTAQEDDDEDPKKKKKKPFVPFSLTPEQEKERENNKRVEELARQNWPNAPKKPNVDKAAPPSPSELEPGDTLTMVMGGDEKTGTTLFAKFYLDDAGKLMVIPSRSGDFDPARAKRINSAEADSLAEKMKIVRYKSGKPEPEHAGPTVSPEEQGSGKTPSELRNGESLLYTDESGKYIRFYREQTADGKGAGQLMRQVGANPQKLGGGQPVEDEEEADVAASGMEFVTSKGRYSIIDDLFRGKTKEEQLANYNKVLEKLDKIRRSYEEVQAKYLQSIGGGLADTSRYVDKSTGEIKTQQNRYTKNETNDLRRNLDWLGQRLERMGNLYALIKRETGISLDENQNVVWMNDTLDKKKKDPSLPGLSDKQTHSPFSSPTNYDSGSPSQATPPSVKLSPKEEAAQKRQMELTSKARSTKQLLSLLQKKKGLEAMDPAMLEPEDKEWLKQHKVITEEYVRSKSITKAEADELRQLAGVPDYQEKPSLPVSDTMTPKVPAGTVTEFRVPSEGIEPGKQEKVKLTPKVPSSGLTGKEWLKKRLKDTAPYMKSPGGGPLSEIEYSGPELTPEQEEAIRDIAHETVNKKKSSVQAAYGTGATSNHFLVKVMHESGSPASPNELSSMLKSLGTSGIVEPTDEQGLFRIDLPEELEHKLIADGQFHVQIDQFILESAGTSELPADEPEASLGGDTLSTEEIEGTGKVGQAMPPAAAPGPESGTPAPGASPNGDMPPEPEDDRPMSEIVETIKKDVDALSEKIDGGEMMDAGMSLEPATSDSGAIPAPPGKIAVDQPAKSYWNELLGEYGRKLTKDYAASIDAIIEKSAAVHDRVITDMESNNIRQWLTLIPNNRKSLYMDAVEAAAISPHFASVMHTLLIDQAMRSDIYSLKADDKNSMFATAVAQAGLGNKMAKSIRAAHKIAQKMKTPSISKQPDDVVDVIKMEDMASDMDIARGAHLNICIDRHWIEGAYVKMDLSWDIDDDSEWSGAAIKHAIISFVKGLESKKEFEDLGVLGTINFDEFDVDGSVATVFFKASRPADAPTRVVTDIED